METIRAKFWPPDLLRASVPLFNGSGALFLVLRFCLLQGLLARRGAELAELFQRGGLEPCFCAFYLGHNIVKAKPPKIAINDKSLKKRLTNPFFCVIIRPTKEESQKTLDVRFNK